LGRLTLATTPEYLLVSLVAQIENQPDDVSNKDAEVYSMALIAAGAAAPDFKLDSHLDTTVSLSDFSGSKNVLLVSYPLDFTPT
jgi:alkyl hydroperoxide reductase subunit AhpC